MTSSRLLMPEQRCEKCGAKATVQLNNRPLCSEHAAEEAGVRR
jgi:hypothetical protein